MVVGDPRRHSICAGCHQARQSQRKALRELRRAIASEFPAGEDAAPRRAGGPIAGQVLASPTELAVEFDLRFGTGQEWQGIYEYLCATANHPSLSAFEFFEFDEQHGLHMNIKDDFLQRLVRATIVAFVKALQSYAGYCEWDPEGIDELIDSTNALLPGSFA